MARGHWLVIALVCVALTACRRKSAPPVEATPEPVVSDTTPASAPPKAVKPSLKSATPAPAKRVPVSTKPAPAELWKEFSGERAWRTAKQLVELGPRPAGSAESGRARGILASALNSSTWEVESQAFTASTPRGDMPGTNLVARFSADGVRPVPHTPRSVVFGAHYDTRLFSTIRFLGANDGASGPAVLIEAARVLALDPKLAAKIELVLFDAGEPRSQFTPADGIAGSKHYAKAATPHRAIVLHAVGDNSGPLTLPPGTPAEIVADLRAATAALHSPLQFQTAPLKLWGDHLALGPGALLLSNHDSVSRYTADDTLERVSPAVLGQVGELVVWLARRWAQ